MEDTRVEVLIPKLSSIKFDNVQTQVYKALQQLLNILTIRNQGISTFTRVSYIVFN